MMVVESELTVRASLSKWVELGAPPSQRSATPNPDPTLPDGGERESERASTMLRGPSSLKSSSTFPLASSSSSPSEPRHLVRKLLFPHLDQRASIPQIWKGSDKETVDLNDE